MTKISRYLTFVFSCILFTCASTNQQKWWLKVAEKQGPMVCPEEYARDNDRMFSVPWTGGKLCGSETIVRFSCCHGYERTQGERGCPLVKPLKNIVDTAVALGAHQFMKHAEQSGLLPLLSNQGAYTVFIARDKAFRGLTKEQERTLNGSKKSRSRPPVLLYTIAEGRLSADDLPNALPTLYREGSATVIKFSTGLTAVNCIPLVATNIEAANGIIHITESLLLPPGRNTISDLLLRTPTLKTLSNLVQTYLSNDLRDKKSITMFSPTDEAWNSLPASFMEALMEDTSSLKVLLKYHIVESIWCTAVTAGKTELKTLEGSTLQIFCNGTAQYVNEAEIIQKDLAARNGFLHHIDSVLIPDKVRSLGEYLEIRGLTLFLRLTEISGILPLLKRKDVYTVFVPTDEAFKDLSNETMSEIFDKPSLARAIVNFHMISGLQLTSNVIDGQTFGTLQGRDSVLRLKIHKKKVTVETALIMERDLQVRNGVVQIIDKVLIAPSSSILDELQEGNFSVFIRLLNQSEPNLLQVLGNTSTTFTLFAPNDDDLNASMPPGMLQRLLSDAQLLYTTMSRHILPSLVVSSILEPGFIYSYATAGGDFISVTKETSDSITVAHLAEVTRADVILKNGVLHEISRLLQM